MSTTAEPAATTPAAEKTEEEIKAEALAAAAAASLAGIKDAATGGAATGIIPNLLADVGVVESKCIEGDQNCLAKEQKERDKVAAAKALEMVGIYQPAPRGVAHKTDSGLTCTLDGFTAMVQEMWEIIFVLAAVVKETAFAAIPPNFQQALKYAWNGAIGMGNWLGYVLGAVYFVSEAKEVAEQLNGGVGLGAEVCEALGYGYWVIAELEPMVNWFPEEEKKNGTDMNNLATQAEKDAAALASVAAANEAFAALAAMQKSAVEKAISEGTDATAAAAAAVTS